MDVNTANQSTTDEQMMDILLVLDKEKKTISAVKGVDENGELQTVPPAACLLACLLARQLFRFTKRILIKKVNIIYLSHIII